jgi:hypothetical protein
MSTNSTTQAIIKYLNLNNYFVWRNNTMGVYDPKKKIYRKNPSQLNGIADIIGIKWDGTFIAIEIKTGADRLSEAQKHFLGEIEAHNGIQMVVKDFDDFMVQFK